MQCSPISPGGQQSAAVFPSGRSALHRPGGAIRPAIPGRVRRKLLRPVRPAHRVDDPWLQIVPCRVGHICPWGGSKLAAVTNTPGPTARKLAILSGASLWQDGSDGATVLFDVALFPQVARLMHPRRCRRLSDEQRAKLIEAGAKHRFSNGAGRVLRAALASPPPYATQKPSPLDRPFLRLVTLLCESRKGKG